MDGTGFNSRIGQTVGPASTNVVGAVTTFSMKREQIEMYEEITLENTNLVSKYITGEDNYLFQSSVTKIVSGTPVRIFDRIKWKYGCLYSFIKPLGVSNVGKWVYRGLESTATVASNSNSGSLTLNAFKDNILYPSPGQTTDKEITVDFHFAFDFTGDGTWDYDYSQVLLDQTQVRDCDAGNFAVVTSGISRTSICSGLGLGSVVSNSNDLGIDWIYWVYDAADFVFGFPAHPSQYYYGFIEFDSEYISRYIPKA